MEQRHRFNSFRGRKKYGPPPVREALAIAALAIAATLVLFSMSS